MELTKQSILSDIEGYNQRIEGAKLKLSTMPASVSDWKERKKLKAATHAHTEEIRHVRQLLSYAVKALAEVAKGESV